MAVEITSFGNSHQNPKRNTIAVTKTDGIHAFVLIDTISPKDIAAKTITNAKIAVISLPPLKNKNIFAIIYYL